MGKRRRCRIGDWANRESGCVQTSANPKYKKHLRMRADLFVVAIAVAVVCKLYPLFRNAFMSFISIQCASSDRLHPTQHTHLHTQSMHGANTIDQSHSIVLCAAIFGSIQKKRIVDAKNERMKVEQKI